MKSRDMFSQFKLNFYRKSLNSGESTINSMSAVAHRAKEDQPPGRRSSEGEGESTINCQQSTFTNEFSD
jgi:hypothetical protein